ncbi:unnamed protein product [Diabrotica balteata]|uniref:Uncharacterized protein n=1 Tax=Diabrotica balteata TaxID=107213 RepID=A0A9N9X6S7_DIABA|nr:unnamed protein product [Diabrotica balteata]
MDNVGNILSVCFHIYIYNGKIVTDGMAEPLSLCRRTRISNESIFHKEFAVVYDWSIDAARIGVGSNISFYSSSFWILVVLCFDYGCFIHRQLSCFFDCYHLGNSI